jgi:lipoprotein-releasing system ATP-binding protein
MDDLIVDNVSREFPAPGEPVVVLRGCSFVLSAGQNLAILGPSGSGKSTLLQIIGGLDRPTSGTVSLCGQNPGLLSERDLAAFRNAKVGFVFQDHHLLPQCTVLENVLAPTIAFGAATGDDVDRARALLDRVGLSGRLAHRPAQLSGGERQRAAIARALIRRPALLLADEPTGNLDRANATRIGDVLLDMQRAEGTMFIAVTHSLELAARLDRRVELNEGRLQ